MFLKKFLFATIFILFVASAILMLDAYPSSAAGVSWYVDNSVVSNGNGQSWAAAWKNFSNINWVNVSCGDTIYISGGPAGNAQVYAERLNVGKSCVQGSPLTITIGTDSLHNGTVKITGQAGLGTGILISSKDWITIDGQSGNDGQKHIEIFQVAGCANCLYGMGGGVTVSGTSVGAKLSYLDIHDIGDKTNDWHTAVSFSLTNSTYAHDHEFSYSKITNTIDCIIVNNSGGIKPIAYGGVKIHHNILACHDDGIQTSVSVDIYNNDISRGSYLALGHPDGLQIYGSYTRIYNNYFHGFLDEQNGNSVVYWEPDGGQNMNHSENKPSNFMLYNNVFYETGLLPVGLHAVSLGLSDTRFTSLNDLYIFNNSFKGNYAGAVSLAWGGTILDSNQISNILIENNIFYNAAKAGRKMLAIDLSNYITTQATYGGHGTGSDIIVDHNLYFRNNDPDDNLKLQIVLKGVYYNYSNFVDLGGTGLQTHPSIGVANVIPVLNETTLAPISSSNAIGNGADLSGMIGLVDTNDKNGIVRTAGSWDIGAYEYITSTPPPPPSALKGDFNSDSKVNDLDFTSFKNAFKSIFNSIFDLNSDNAIDVKDLGVLMSGWLP